MTVSTTGNVTGEPMPDVDRSSAAAAVAALHAAGRERYLNRRIEALVPVNDPGLQDRLAHILAVALDEAARAWTLRPDGTWQPPAPGSVSTHDTLAAERA